MPPAHAIRERARGSAPVWHDPGVKIPKPTEADRARFTALIPDAPGVEIKPMFGNLGAFVNGNMFAGLFGLQIGVKLDPAKLAELRNAGGGPFGPAERPMGGYVTLPEGVVDAQGQAWVEAALAHVGSLPPKAAEQRRKS